jgi:hypothetical protein
MSAIRSPKRPIQRTGLLHVHAPLSASQRRSLLMRIASAARAPEGRRLGEVVAYASDEERGLMVGTSSDRMAIYLGLRLEPTLRRQPEFGLLPGGRRVYVCLAGAHAARAVSTPSRRKRPVSKAA